MRRERVQPKRIGQVVVRGLHTVDHVLRRSTVKPSFQSADVAKSQSESTGACLRFSTVVNIVLVFGLCYGASMGSYAAMIGEKSCLQQLPQMIVSGVKVPLLIAFTVLISTPSFFVLNSLFGLRADFGDALKAVVSAQAGLTVVLASMAPLTIFSYSFLNYQAAVLFNAILFAVASISAQFLLLNYYQPLFARNKRHRSMMKLWIVVYAFVGIQAAYTLRPFIGEPNQPTAFFRHESFQNAYVKVAEMMISLGKRMLE